MVNSWNLFLDVDESRLASEIHDWLAAVQFLFCLCIFVKKDTHLPTQDAVYSVYSVCIYGILYVLLVVIVI